MGVNKAFLGRSLYQCFGMVDETHLLMQVQHYFIFLLYICNARHAIPFKSYFQTILFANSLIYQTRHLKPPMMLNDSIFIIRQY